MHPEPLVRIESAVVFQTRCAALGDITDVFISRARLVIDIYRLEGDSYGSIGLADCGKKNDRRSGLKGY